ncbi:CBS domain-containing protein [Rossellomorea aquimaris]|jgi:CBS domain-containing protein|uniref:CBS domain-containing protein n=1 Tax=Rossellomorea aquimaris TaxID=189382 RepID=A0A366ENZ1_9BACI|nr:MULTISPECIES: CBS domain-containing protein [Bacillaceae]KAA0560630.1 CBS domain-containing protein [Bacillus sp. CH30_1T]RBP03195.1 CBS domain-containing protein [Rossellomorea aquimaris]WRP06821.1 CBS domain-containing protein [Rossellomorea aquimaris]
MQVRDIMSTNVEAASNQDSLQSVASKMSSKNVGSVPVVENGQVVGMVTDRDIATRGLTQGAQGNVSQVMSQQVVTISPDASVEEASALMSQHQVRRLPVVENGQLVGMLALGDLAVQQQSDQSAGSALSGISQNHLR